MTGITTYHPTLTALLKASKYKPFELEEKILATDPDIRNSITYKEAQEELMDATMSCDVGEACDYMRQEYRFAVAYGIDSKSLFWKPMFLAAYDLYTSLMKEGE